MPAVQRAAQRDPAALGVRAGPDPGPGPAPGPGVGGPTEHQGQAGGRDPHLPPPAGEVRGLRSWSRPDNSNSVQSVPKTTARRMWTAKWSLRSATPEFCGVKAAGAGHPYGGGGGQYIVQRSRGNKEPWASFPHRIHSNPRTVFNLSRRSVPLLPQAAPWATAPRVLTAGGILLPGHCGPSCEAPGAARPGTFQVLPPRAWHSHGTRQAGSQCY